MKTELYSGENARDIALCAQMLREGEVVAIPTETVYGLAADATNDAALLKIFEAKGRPQDNPLIVHIADAAQLEDLCEHVPDEVYALARAFWPGPLTMVLKKSGAVSAVASGGLDTVGVRMPAHPVARALIRQAGIPLAAPSANVSGRPSPTSAAHVLSDLAGRIPAVLDGGDCPVGVESTVVDMTAGRPLILRPGAVTEEMIAAVLGSAETDPDAGRAVEADGSVRSPGMKYVHYAPRARLALFCGPPDSTASAVAARAEEFGGAICFDEYGERMRAHFARDAVFNLGESWDHGEHSRRLYAVLRALDDAGVRTAAVQCPRAEGAGVATVNRLLRAAGFNRVDCGGGRRVIGVTGRSGAGKSHLCAQLALRGAFVFDADAVYRDMLEHDDDMKQALLRAFPAAARGGAVDRRALGGIVFSDAQALIRLNEITHPRVLARGADMIARSGSTLVALDAPLLFESGADRMCDLTVAVTAARSASLERIRARDGIGRDGALARLSAQPDDVFYTRRCDIIVKNDGDIDSFDMKCAAFISKYTNI